MTERSPSVPWEGPSAFFPDAERADASAAIPHARSSAEFLEEPSPGATAGMQGALGRKRRRRRRGGKGGAAHAESVEPLAAGEHDDDEPLPTGEVPASEGPGGGKKRRRRRRRGRGRGGDSDLTAGEEPAEGPVAVDPALDDEEPEPLESDNDAPARGRTASKRRRRKRRGGRKEARGGDGPVGVEFIPGEEDELAAMQAEDAELLPELPEEAALLEHVTLAPGASRSSRRKRRKRRGKGEGRESHEASEREEQDEDLERDEEEVVPRRPASKPNVILVNAADREETRVAVVENGVIVDFQMTVKRHKSLVNDIYRGRVVNLEPAIGAAFIDFGQGRNGFLHTSDVLSVYGDEDWSLEKLLTTKVDAEEWDEESGAPEAGSEAGERSEDAEPGHGEDDDGHAELEPRHEHEDEHGAGHDHGDAHDDPAELESGEMELAPLESEAPARARSGPRRQVRAKGPAEKRARGSRNGRPRARPRLPITDLLEKGDSVVVQVTKDAIGDKGPTLTTYISIPGRYLVLMPSMARTGVSRKIEDEKERRRLKRILESLDVPAGMGVIVRTAGIGCTKADLKRDLEYLMLLWESFGQRLTLGRGPATLYEESDVAIRTIRDLFTDDTEAVIVDDARVCNRVREFTQKLMPEHLERIRLHEGHKPLFHAHAVEQDFERIFARRIDLPSGGSIVLDQTEALVAIDVNSGKTRSDGFDFEEIALKTNLDAVHEIARQIRLRDLGGIIVCDFIDMVRTSSRRRVERALRDALATDRARSKLGRISQFGLLELTRQRLGPGLSKMLFHNCTRCRGSGRLRTVESRTGAILRRLGAALTLKGFTKVEVRTQPEVVDNLNRHYAAELKELQTRFERELVLVRVDDQVDDCVLRYLRADGREVRPGGRRKR